MRGSERGHTTRSSDEHVLGPGEAGVVADAGHQLNVTVIRTGGTAATLDHGYDKLLLRVRGHGGYSAWGVRGEEMIGLSLVSVQSLCRKGVN